MGFQERMQCFIQCKPDSLVPAWETHAREVAIWETCADIQLPESYLDNK